MEPKPSSQSQQYRNLLLRVNGTGTLSSESTILNTPSQGGGNDSRRIFQLMEQDEGISAERVVRAILDPKSIAAEVKVCLQRAGSPKRRDDALFLFLVLKLFGFLFILVTAEVKVCLQRHVSSNRRFDTLGRDDLELSDSSSSRERCFGR